MRVYKETEGKVLVKGENLYNNKSTLELITLNQTMQMIFQDPYASLNPRMTIIDIVAEGLDIHGLTSTKDERKARVTDLLETVGLKIGRASCRERVKILVVDVVLKKKLEGSV